MSPHVLVLHNRPLLSPDHPDFQSEYDIVHTAQAVVRALRRANMTVVRLALGRNVRPLLEFLQGRRPDAVFNLYEGTGADGSTEVTVAGLLEWSGVPYTGCPPAPLALARRKELTKALFRGAGLPTPRSFVVHDLPVPRCTLRWPVIVKPAHQDASVGIDAGSVVTAQAPLKARARRLIKRYGPPVLVEEYIDGRELNVAVVGVPRLSALPPGEILFRAPAKGGWRIVTYDAKWKPGSAADRSTPPNYPAELTPALSGRLQQLALTAFRLLGCRDYARVDFRVSASGRPYLLEVNPNPDFGPSAGLARSLASIGRNHAAFAAELVHHALAASGSF